MNVNNAERFLLGSKNLEIVEGVIGHLITDFLGCGVDHKTVGDLREMKHLCRGVRQQLKLTVKQAEKALAGVTAEVTP